MPLERAAPGQRQDEPQGPMASFVDADCHEDCVRGHASLETDPSNLGVRLEWEQTATVVQAYVVFHHIVICNKQINLKRFRMWFGTCVGLRFRLRFRMWFRVRFRT